MTVRKLTFAEMGEKIAKLEAEIEQFNTGKLSDWMKVQMEPLEKENAALNGRLDRVREIAEEGNIVTLASVLSERPDLEMKTDKEELAALKAVLGQVKEWWADCTWADPWASKMDSILSQVQKPIDVIHSKFNAHGDLDIMESYEGKPNTEVDIVILPKEGS